jgi:hypothetical protein
VRVLEIEFGYWCKRFATRTTEHKDVHAGLELLGQSRQELQARRDAYRKELGHLRRVKGFIARFILTHCFDKLQWFYDE